MGNINLFVSSSSLSVIWERYLEVCTLRFELTEIHDLLKYHGRDPNRIELMHRHPQIERRRFRSKLMPVTARRVWPYKLSLLPSPLTTTVSTCPLASILWPTFLKRNLDDICSVVSISGEYTIERSCDMSNDDEENEGELYSILFRLNSDASESRWIRKDVEPICHYFALRLEIGWRQVQVRN